MLAFTRVLHARATNQLVELGTYSQYMEGWCFVLSQETRVPATGVLQPHELGLLEDPGITLGILGAGDIGMFSSGSAHFATNGAKGVNAALYHGWLTPATVPYLCDAALKIDPFSDAERTVSPVCLCFELFQIVFPCSCRGCYLVTNIVEVLLFSCCTCTNIGIFIRLWYIEYSWLT